MRTIRLYKGERGRGWMSPSRFLGALLSRDKITFVDHGGLSLAQQIGALSRAYDEIRQMLFAEVVQCIAGLMWMAATLGVLLYPPLGLKVAAPIRSILVLLVAAGIIATLSQIAQSLFTRVIVDRRRVEVHRRRGPDLAPPHIALRTPSIPRPQFGWALCAFLAITMLSSVIVATPMRPAVVNDRVIESTTLVLPGTSWTPVERYPEGRSLGILRVLAATIWVVRVDYSVERMDLASTADFDDRMDNVVSYYVDLVNKQMSMTWDADTTPEEELLALKNAWNDPEFLQQFDQALRRWFYQMYGDELHLRNVSVSVRQCSYSEYRKWIQQ